MLVNNNVMATLDQGPCRHFEIGGAKNFLGVLVKTTQKSYEMTIFVVRLGVFCIE